MGILDRLRKADIEERAAILEERYNKNLQYFKKSFPEITEFLSTQLCPYHIDCTESFLNIVHSSTGEIAHPEIGLDIFAETLGDWTHDTWVDLIDLEIQGNPSAPIHYHTIDDFHTHLTTALPQYSQRFQQGRINLKDFSGTPAQKFSPPVIFLGIFHGLHIERYLSRTVLTNCMLIEPEPERFEVSCYFLDYEAIEKQFGRLTLSIGSDYSNDAIKSFFNFDRVTPQMWTRVLPAYVSSHMAPFMEAIKTQQHAGTRIFFPIDSELKGLINTLKNLRKGLPILTKRPKLSKVSRIVIVATGPSLNSDIAWLKKNQKKIIVFAVHSCVALLKRHGIVPDFQFSIETKAESDATKGTLYSHVPTIAYCRADESWNDAVDRLLLVSENSKAQLVQFLHPLRNTHPSTTNLAFSFACYCRPKTLYLCGCDFGYKEQGRHHAEGSLWQPVLGGDKGTNYATANGATIVTANFQKSGSMLSQPFLNQARLVVEEALANTCQNIEVINISDGAKIIGTKSLESRHLKIKKYVYKGEDCNAISEVFKPPLKGFNIEPHAMDGQELLNRYINNIIDMVTVESFGMYDFAKVLDTILDKKLGLFSYNETDWRMDIYSRLLNDMLRCWYRVLLFCESQEEEERVYKEGLDFFIQELRQLRWPEELSHIDFGEGS